MKPIITYLGKMRGGKKSPPRAPWHEVFWSALGGFFGIYAIYFIGDYHGLHVTDSLFLVGSFGASAILIYGVPNSPYAQPRNLIGGHVTSAIVGVTCVLVLSTHVELAITASAAVSLSLVVMHLTRTIHPPGGATALIAVIGGEKIHHLGYWYVFTPIAEGAIIMLVVAVIINNHSPHRRYPQYWL